eukprot:4329950-Prymnesium_polylepis.1
MARTLGTYLNDQPPIRQPILQGLSLLVLTQRAQKSAVPRADGTVAVELTADAKVIDCTDCTDCIDELHRRHGGRRAHG